MRVFATSPTLPNLRFLCLKCGTDWAAAPSEYTISRSEINAEWYEGVFDGSFDAANYMTLTSCPCPVCSKIAYHGKVYDGSMEDTTSTGTDSVSISPDPSFMSDPDDSGTAEDVTIIPTKSIQLTFDVTAGSSYTYPDSSITSDMVVAAASIPDGVRSGAWNISTGTGKLTISGTIAAAGTVTMVLTQAGIQDTSEGVYTCYAVSLNTYTDSDDRIWGYADMVIPKDTYKVVIHLVDDIVIGTTTLSDVVYDTSTLYAESSNKAQGYTIANGHITDGAVDDSLDVTYDASSNIITVDLGSWSGSQLSLCTGMRVASYTAQNDDDPGTFTVDRVVIERE